MQKWTPHRKLEKLETRRSSLLGATERNGHEKNVTNQSVMISRTAERPQAKNVSKTDNSNAPNNGQGAIVTNNHGFVTAKGLDNLVKDRKRYSTEAAAEEPARKKMLPNNNAVIESNVTKVETVKKELKQQFCLSGDVEQVMKLSKNCPSSLNPFYEVYAKVYKVDSSKAGQKTLLLRNNSGPVLEAIFHEIDVKMVPVEPGDAVRCVGKLVNNSRLQMFKISVISENYNTAFVSRLYCISNYAVGRKAAQP